MENDYLFQKCTSYMRTLCAGIPGRSVGSAGNRQATRFYATRLAQLGWQVETSELDVIDWEDGGAALAVGDQSFEVFASPYSLGCAIQAPLACISTVEALESEDITGKILLLHGEIAQEQVMPKNFVFYNPEEHQHIVSLLEQKQPAAIITATGRNSALAGGAYPFPMFEDGDFDIPSVYMTDVEGERLLAHTGCAVHLESRAVRIPEKAYNVIARKGKTMAGRVVISAHIDAKIGTPGAMDNATGVATLLLLAELLKDYDGETGIELVAFNGEDYYAVSGQMDYIGKLNQDFGDIALNINIDGAGYHKGKSAISFYDVPENIQAVGEAMLAKFDGLTEGAQWYQGDHSIFIQNGRPAIAVSSNWFAENMESQDITHTPKDNLDIIDCHKVVEIAEALAWFLRKL